MDVAAVGNGELGSNGAETPQQEIRPVETDPTKRYARYEQVLGRGAFKTVYKAFDESDGIEVAWNQVKVNDLVSSPSERERLFAEIRVLKQLKHKNIMTFFDSWLDQKNMTVNFITELFTSGTLRQYRKKHKRIDEQVLKRWAWQVLQGLVYLHAHEPPIIHRDLKCDNIFVNGSSGVIKIGDLGLATLWRGLTMPQSVLGTPEFMAPELYEEKYDEKVDVYSFGMCMLELATMEYPYAECRNAAQIYKKVTQGVHPAGLELVANQELRDFIMLCINHDPSRRPEARQLLKHTFFDSVRSGKPGAPPERPACCAEVVAPCHSESELLCVVDVSRCPSSGSDSGSVASPKSHATQLLNVAEMEAMSAAEEAAEAAEARREAAAALAAAGGGDGAGGGCGMMAPSLMAAGDGDVSRRVTSDGAVDLVGGDTAFGSGEVGDAAGDGGEGAGGGGASGGGDDAGGETEREFCVACQEAEDSKLSFQLKFTEPEGHCKTVEFTFDMAEDTAECIANEMMEDLSLSADEAEAIADKIKHEISRISGTVVDAFTTIADGAGGISGLAGRPGPGSPAQQLLERQGGGEAGHQRLQETVMANAAAAAVAAVAAAAAAANSGGSPAATAAPLPALARAPAADGLRRSGSGRDGSSGALAPPDTSRPPSYMDLVRAMRECHEQQQAEARAAAEAAAADMRACGCGADGGGGEQQAQGPLEVLLPNGHALDAAVLAKVAATAATAAAQQLQDALPSPARHSGGAGAPHASHMLSSNGRI